MLSDTVPTAACHAAVPEPRQAVRAGEAVSFSEQQLVDCSWSYGANMACDGGDFDAAMDYLAEAGGAMQASAYPYRGANGFCRDANSSSTPPVQFKVSGLNE